MGNHQAILNVLFYLVILLVILSDIGTLVRGGGPARSLAGLKIIFFLLSDMMSIMDVFHAGHTSFMSDIFTLPLVLNYNCINY